MQILKKAHEKYTCYTKYDSDLRAKFMSLRIFPKAEVTIVVSK